MLLRLSFFTLLCAWSVVVTAANSVETRYGRVDAVSTTEEIDKFVLSYKGTKLAVLEGMDINIYRVTPKGPTEYLIIEKVVAGMHCHNEYSILEISPAGTTALSKTFGECSEFQGATYLVDGALIELNKAYVEGKKKQNTERYKWSKGTLTKQP